LRWATTAGDDFHRLEAVEGLIGLGDERVAGIATAMLQENRKPIRRDPDYGFTSMSHVETIATLVRRMLRASPSKALRRLAKIVRG
jgi:hypothetical protein